MTTPSPAALACASATLVERVTALDTNRTEEGEVKVLTKAEALALLDALCIQAGDLEECQEHNPLLASALLKVYAIAGKKP